MIIDAKTIEVGAEIPPLSKVMSIESMRLPLVSGGNPIHYDEEFAKRQGLRAPIATGMISSGYLSEMLTRFFGLHWIQGSNMRVTYIAPVYAGDAVSCRGVVREKTIEGATTKLDLEIWCQNQHGEKVTVGTASVKLPQGIWQ